MREVPLIAITSISTINFSFQPFLYFQDENGEIKTKTADAQAISDVLIKIKARVSNTNEVSCIDAIIKIFEMVDQLDYLNKRAVFVYVRDISGLSPKQLSISMSIIRKHYKDLVGPDKEFQLF